MGCARVRTNCTASAYMRLGDRLPTGPPTPPPYCPLTPLPPRPPREPPIIPFICLTQACLHPPVFVHSARQSASSFPGMRIHAIARVSTLYPGYPFAVLCTARVAVLLSSRCAALSWPFIWLGIHRPVVMLMVYRESDRMLIVCRVPCADFRVLERVRQRTDMAVSSPVLFVCVLAPM